MLNINLLEQEDSAIAHLLEKINAAKDSETKGTEIFNELDNFAKMLMSSENIPHRLASALQISLRDDIKMFISLGGLMACVYCAYFAGLHANKETPAIAELEKLFKLE